MSVTDSMKFDNENPSWQKNTRLHTIERKFTDFTVIGEFLNGQIYTQTRIFLQTFFFLKWEPHKTMQDISQKADTKTSFS